MATGIYLGGWGQRGRSCAAVSEVPSGRRGILRGTTTPFRFGVNFSYYGLTLDVSGLGLNVYQTQLLFGAVELPSKIMVYFLVRHLGRRLTEAGMLLGAALTFGTSLLVSLGKPAWHFLLPSVGTLPRIQGAPGSISSLRNPFPTRD